MSIVIPCFNHGRFLPETIESVRRQSYPDVETIIVDDASSDPETRQVLENLEQEGIQVVRLDVNSGPSVARNAAIERATGRFLLFLDADNVLLSSAIESLVTQLRKAGEEIGFVYPNLQYIGNRTDYFEAPPYNLHRLMRGNYCDTCSLFDREVFDAGARFPEDVRLGHEDWDFVLWLAARRVFGQPAREPTLLYRKWGFNRSDAVEYSGGAFGDQVVERHPELYELEADHKAEWAPALSIVPLQPLGEGEALKTVAGSLARQTAHDVELLARFTGSWPRPRPWGTGPVVRRFAVDVVDGSPEMLVLGHGAARGGRLLFAEGTGAGLLEDRAFAEKVLRIFVALSALPLEAIAFADAGSKGRFPFRLLDADEDLPTLRAHAVVVSAAALDRLEDAPVIESGREVDSLVRALVRHGAEVQWRHQPAPAPASIDSNGAPRRLSLANGRDGSRNREQIEYQRSAFPALPSMLEGTVPRWTYSHTFAPPACLALCRHRSHTDGVTRRVTTDWASPPGFELEYALGFIRIFPFEGTSRLVALDDGYLVEGRAAPVRQEEDGRTLGYVDDVGFVLLDALMLCTHIRTGKRVLVCGQNDPLWDEVEPLSTLGYLDGLPMNPRREPHAKHAYGLVGLLRAVDVEERRHRYAVSARPRGQLVGELGALVNSPGVGLKPLWITDDGNVAIGPHGTADGRPDPTAALRWVLAPAAWPTFSQPKAKARAVGRRAYEAARRLAFDGARELAPLAMAPSGYLYDSPDRGRVPLYAALHPVTGDQLITRSKIEATDMGYESPTLLGYAVTVAPVTGSLELTRVSVPWASRYGMVARLG